MTKEYMELLEDMVVNYRLLRESKADHELLKFITVSTDEDLFDYTFDYSLDQKVREEFHRRFAADSHGHHIYGMLSNYNNALKTAIEIK